MATGNLAVSALDCRQLFTIQILLGYIESCFEICVPLVPLASSAVISTCMDCTLLMGREDGEGEDWPAMHPYVSRQKSKSLNFMPMAVPWAGCS